MSSYANPKNTILPYVYLTMALCYMYIAFVYYKH